MYTILIYLQIASLQEKHDLNVHIDTFLSQKFTFWLASGFGFADFCSYKIMYSLGSNVAGQVFC